MARPVTTLVVFFILVNLFAGLFMATGVAAIIGVDTDVSGDAAVDKRTNADQDIETGSPTGSTLFGMYNVLAGQLGNLFDVIYPGIQMLENGGVPTPITNRILEPIASVIILIDVLSFVRGWGL